MQYLVYTITRFVIDFNYSSINLEYSGNIRRHFHQLLIKKYRTNGL